MIRTPYECLYVRLSNFLIMFNQCHKLTDGPERVKESEKEREREIEIERENEEERERKSERK